MLVVFVRTIILYVLVIIVMRIMGKRQIGQLQPFELVVTIMLSELAAVPMQNTGIPLVNGVIPIVTLLFLQIILSYLNLKSEAARKIICGTPSIVVQNGKVVENELGRLQYGLNDLMEQLRTKDVSNIADVEFAILETNGELSVILKSQKRPVTPADLKIQTDYEGLTVTLILDGKVNHDNLIRSNISEKWLKRELTKFKVDDISEVFLCTMDTNKKLYVQKRSEKENNQ